MHTNLERPHPDCQPEIAALVKCHDDHPYAKFWGACGEVKTKLDWCFKHEKIRIRSENFRKAKASDAYVRQKMRERHERMATETAKAGAN